MRHNLRRMRGSTAGGESRGPTADRGQGGGSRAKCGGCDETIHVVLQSEPEHERREGACKLHSRQHQHEQGERWLCLNCLQRHARALYKHKRRPQGPAGYLRGEIMEEYRRLPRRARREEERGDEAGPGPAAGDAPVGEDEGKYGGVRRKRKHPMPRDRKRKRNARELYSTQENPGDTPAREERRENDSRGQGETCAERR